MNLSSFKHAINGIIGGIKSENNFRKMILCFLLVLVANVFLKVTVIEWIITLICSGMVLSLELINSAIEKTIDFTTDDFHHLAGAAKDYSAGATLITSIIAFIVAVLVYLPYIIDIFGFT